MAYTIDFEILSHDVYSKTILFWLIDCTYIIDESLLLELKANNFKPLQNYELLGDA